MPTFPKKISGPKITKPASIGKSLTTSKPTAFNTKTVNPSTKASACK